MTSRTTHYRKLRRAKELGCSVDDLPDNRGKHGNHARGNNHPRYNGGEWKHVDGYIAVKVPIGHHLRMANGYAYQHQLVAEDTLGRQLKTNEVVHHKNGIRTDNRPENLEVLTRAEHAKKHSDFDGARDNFGRFNPNKRHDPAEWPEDLRVQEFPEVRDAAL